MAGLDYLASDASWTGPSKCLPLPALADPLQVSLMAHLASHLTNTSSQPSPVPTETSSQMSQIFT